MLDSPTQPHNGRDKFVDLSGLYILGAGGVNSRIEIHSTAATSTKSSLHLTPFHSVYALDLNCETGNLSAGTKGGLILIIEAVPGSLSLESSNIVKIYQGAPVLSICWASPEMLVVSDAAGRCLLWQYRSSPAIPRYLPTIDSPICALLRLDENTIVGLSANGRLHFWQPNSCQLKHTIDVPRPPSKSALVQMKYWTEKNAIVFPTDEGKICLVTPFTSDVDCFSLNNGQFYAFGFFKEFLACASFSNVHFFLFSKDSSKPVGASRLLEGVTSMHIAESTPANALFVGRSGRRFRCIIKYSGVESMEYLPGEDFRSISGPDMKTVRCIESQKAKQEAETIILELNGRGDRIDDKERSEYLERLEHLGYKHVALALEADRMDSIGNIVDSIGSREDLLRLLPKDDPRSSLSLSKYANSLETAWQLSEAYTYLSMVHRSTPELVEIDHLEKLKSLSKIVEESDKWIIDPSLTIDTVISVSTVLKKQFKGRYVLRKLSPITCGSHNIGSNQIAEKYSQIRRELQQRALPVAVSKDMWLITTTGAKLVPTVGFVSKRRDHPQHPQLVLLVINNDFSTIISPVTVFAWQSGQAGDYKQANENARRQLGLAINQKENGYMLSVVYQYVEMAVRRIITTLSSVQMQTP